MSGVKQFSGRETAQILGQSKEHSPILWKIEDLARTRDGGGTGGCLGEARERMGCQRSSHPRATFPIPPACGTQPGPHVPRRKATPSLTCCSVTLSLALFLDRDDLLQFLGVRGSEIVRDYCSVSHILNGGSPATVVAFHGLLIFSRVSERASGLSITCWLSCVSFDGITRPGRRLSGCAQSQFQG